MGLFGRKSRKEKKAEKKEKKQAKRQDKKDAKYQKELKMVHKVVKDEMRDNESIVDFVIGIDGITSGFLVLTQARLILVKGVNIKYLNIDKVVSIESGFSGLKIKGSNTELDAGRVDPDRSAEFLRKLNELSDGETVATTPLSISC